MEHPNKAKKNHYIYKITNNINGKYYYGKRSCKCAIDKDPYMGSGTLLRKALLKHGTDNFTKEILAICDSAEDTLELEEMLVTLKEVNDPMCYNMICGGRVGTTGLKHSDEAKAKISKAATVFNTGRICTEETRNKRRLLMTGKTHTIEAIAKMSESQKGRTHSEATKAKMSKPVIQLSMTGEFIQEWVSATEAGKILGIGQPCITSTCNGNRKSAGGFKWKKL